MFFMRAGLSGAFAGPLFLGGMCEMRGSCFLMLLETESRTAELCRIKFTTGRGVTDFKFSADFRRSLVAGRSMDALFSLPIAAEGVWMLAILIILSIVR